MSSPSMTFTITTPPVSPAATSMESASLERTSGLITSLSTTISMVCFWFLFSSIGSFRSYSRPSTLARTKPERLAPSNSFWWVPFLPRTTGASTCTRVFSGRAST